MENSVDAPSIPASLGHIQPHSGLLRVPDDSQLLYKVMSVENLLRSVAGEYLHFIRVDSYVDSAVADRNDGAQLPMDRAANASTKFQKAPEYSASDYCDLSRARSYATCLSTENSDAIWNKYGVGGARGKVCVVFEFGKLRDTLNKTLAPGNAALMYGDIQCKQILSVNYGLIEYVDWKGHRTNERFLSNPILYTYIKDAAQFMDENELRISLSALGIGQFKLDDGSTMEFPQSLQLTFDYRGAI